MNEIIKKARAAKSAGELIELAKVNGKEMTAEQAAAIFNSINRSGEISDDELEYAAGGCAVRAHGQKMVSALNSCGHWKCKYCNEYNGTDLKKKDHYLDEEYLVDCVGACLP